MPRISLSLVVGAILLSIAHVSGTALPMPTSSCREDDSPTKLPKIALPNPTKNNADFVLAEIWDRHLKWDKLAKCTKNTVYWGRVSSLVLLFSGGILQTLAHTAAAGTLTSFGGWVQTNDAIAKLAGSASVGMAHFIHTNFANKDEVRDWTQAMAIAEKIKGRVYRFQAAIPPYEKNDFEAIKRLVLDVTEMSEADMDLTLKYARTNLGNKEKKILPPRLGRKEYLEERYQPQVKKYLDDAERISKKLSWLKTFRGTLLAASTGIGPLSLVSNLGKRYAKTMNFLGAWPSTLTSGAMAIATHYQECKYDEEAEQWSSAAMELQNLRLKLPNDAEPDYPGEMQNEWRTFVIRCEENIERYTVDWAVLKNRPHETEAKKK